MFSVNSSRSSLVIQGTYRDQLREKVSKVATSQGNLEGLMIFMNHLTSPTVAHAQSLTSRS